MTLGVSATLCWLAARHDQIQENGPWPDVILNLVMHMVALDSRHRSLTIYYMYTLDKLAWGCRPTLWLKLHLHSISVAFNRSCDGWLPLTANLWPWQQTSGAILDLLLCVGFLITPLFKLRVLSFWNNYNGEVLECLLLFVAGPSWRSFHPRLVITILFPIFLIYQHFQLMCPECGAIWC